jgi:hypothetical protein
MRPKQETRRAMVAQMVAERERRADFILAEGDKAAMRLRSEGDKMAKINIGVATQEATRKRSEGEAQAQVEIARAEKSALDAISEAITADGASQTEFMISQRYNELMRTICSEGSSDATRWIYLPYEASSISGIIGGLPKAYGRAAPRAGGNRAAVPVGASARGRAADEFSDLN